MTRATFFKHFDLLADQPDAVAKMRELVLQLAIQGKLLVCDPKDTTAHKLAARVRAAKEGDFAPISKEEVPFELAASWEWVRIGEAMNLINGRAFKPTDWSRDGLPIVRIQNLNNPDAPFNYCNFEVDEKVIIRDGDFLISWSGTPGTSFGAFIWNRGKAVLNQHIFRAELLGDAYTKEFLRLAVNGRLDEMIAKAHGAVGLQHITKGKLELLVLPLPPLAEQRRIVAKVDELMALCDELAARQQARHDARAQLQQSALHHLTHAQTPAEFRRHLDFVIHHSAFDLNDLPQLRQTILQLAVEGRLITQSDKDKPASDILENLRALQARFVKERLAKPYAAPAISSQEKFVPLLPKGWTWVRLKQLGYFCVGATPSMNKSVYWGDGIPWVTPKDMKLPRIVGSEMSVTPLALQETRLRMLPKKSVLIVGRSGILKRLLPVAVTEIECVVNQDMKVLVPFMPELGDYIRVMLCGFQTFILENLVKGGMTVQSLKYDEFEEQPFPLPPLAEQKRIVARVEALLRQCDALEAQLHQTRTLGAHLLDSTLHYLLAA